MRLWQGLRPFAEEKTPFGFLENHLRSARPFQTTIPAVTVSGGLEKVALIFRYFPGTRFDKVGENCHRPTTSIFYVYIIIYIYIILRGMICQDF